MRNSPEAVGKEENMSEKESIKIEGRIPYELDKFNQFSDKLIEITRKYFTGDKVLYARVVEALEERKNIFQISLITDEMIDLDKAFINLMEEAHVPNEDGEAALRENANGYHPYFFEFLTQPLYSPKVHFLNSLQGKWVEVRVRPITRRKQKADENATIVRGNLIFGASPATQQPMELVITGKQAERAIPTDSMWEELQKPTDEKVVARIKTTWENTIQAVQNINCRIYNVGQGNCISLLLNDKLEVFFDIGHSNQYYYGSKNAREKQIIENFRHILTFSTPQWIILSHWHMDHVNGYDSINENRCWLKKADYNVYSHCFWIAPHLKLLKNRPSDRVIRLAFYALANHTLWMVDQEDRMKPVMPDVTDSSKMILWQGLLKDKNDRAGIVANDTGLLLQLKNVIDSDNTQFVLFPGDCSYKHFPKLLKGVPYQLLVTPHHGSADTVPDLAADTNSSLQAKAVLSVGRNTYGHPAPEHMGSLLEQGFQLEYTPGCCYLETKIVFGQGMTKLSRVQYKDWCLNTRNKRRLSRLLRGCSCCRL